MIGGSYKNSDNEIAEELADGTRRVRFQPVPAWETADCSLSKPDRVREIVKNSFGKITETETVVKCPDINEREGDTMNQETIERIRKFTEDRDWDQFHSPANLAKSIVIEAAELLECFQWSDKEYDLQHVKEELADVLVYSQNLLDKLGLDANEIINMKMNQNEAKYPVEKAKGKADKYDKL